MTPVFSSSRLPWLCALVLTFMGSGCVVDDCETRYRCLGEGQYESCNVGSDWEAHRVLIDCKAPNAACVQLEEDSVRCVYAPAVRCDGSFVDRCEGTRRVYCEEVLGWVQAVDCVALGSTGCHVDAALGTAVCD
ncbi:hypothetical protein [Archangium sp.]|jgi:hypothetical protein|uniref:hypothetical protein n=1 Tax=Archangium sp. TaxID=1872627 RepID=UPI002EDB6BE6